MKTKNVFFFFLAVLLFSGCNPLAFLPKSTGLVGSGKFVMENRNVIGFSAVEVTGAGDLIVTQGDSDMLTLEADDNILPRIKTNVSNGVLHIDLETKTNKKISTQNPIRYNVQMKTLGSLSLSGSGSIVGQNISTGSLKIDINGGGTATLSGTCSSLEIVVKGGAKLQAGELQCHNAHISITGAGAVTVWASENLTVVGTGISVINYYGSPKITQNGNNIVMTSLGPK